MPAAPSDQCFAVQFAGAPAKSAQNGSEALSRKATPVFWQSTNSCAAWLTILPELCDQTICEYIKKLANNKFQACQLDRQASEDNDSACPKALSKSARFGHVLLLQD